MSTTTLLVRQHNLASTRLLTADDTPLEGGQVRVRVESFALTANNITYAALATGRSAASPVLGTGA